MAYANNYNRGYRSNGGNYQQRSYSYNGSRQYNTYAKKKHSGCKFKPSAGAKGAPVTYGWNYSKSEGLVSLMACTYKGTSVHKSKNGREWLNVMVKLTKRLSAPVLCSGLMDATTGKVIINDMGIVMNPQAPNGGYVGRFGGKR